MGGLRDWECGWRGGLGSLMALGPRPGSRPPDRVRGRLGQALRGDDVGGSSWSRMDWSSGRSQYSGSRAPWMKSMGTGTWGRWARVGLEMGSGREGEIAWGTSGVVDEVDGGRSRPEDPSPPDRVRGRLQPSPPGEGLRRPGWLGDGDGETELGTSGVVDVVDGGDRDRKTPHPRIESGAGSNLLPQERN